MSETTKKDPKETTLGATNASVGGAAAGAQGTTRGVQQVFEAYQKARMAFVQSVAELAMQPKNLSALQTSGVMALLRPLLLDTVPSVQQNAAQALGRLANYSAEVAERVVAADILPQLVYSLTTQTPAYRKAAAFVLRSVAKHNEHLAQCVVDAKAGEALIAALETVDPTVRENAAWAIGYIAKHTPGLAQTMVDAGAVPLLVVCLQEPEPSLKQIAASTLADIAKHTPELAQTIVSENAIGFLAPLVTHKDSKLKRQALSCLAQISKHTPELAQNVAASEVIPRALERLKDQDPSVRKSAATLIREVVKHTAQLAAAVVGAGGAAALVDFVVNAGSGGDPAAKLPGIMALGFIAACNETLAWAVVEAKAVDPLSQAISGISETQTQAAANEANAIIVDVSSGGDALRSVTAWTLGQIGRHTSEHAAAVADSHALTFMLNVLKSDASSEDTKTKAKRALKAVIQKCTRLAALEPLLDSPQGVQKYVVHQFAKVLPQASEVASRKAFVANGSLAKVLRIEAADGTPIREHINAIKACYDEEIIRFYSPGYSRSLLEKLDAPNTVQAALPPNQQQAQPASQTTQQPK